MAAFSEVYNTKNVGSGKTLTPAGSVNDGNSGNNYAVTVVANTTGLISTRPITVTAAGGTKVYDGSTSSTFTPTITGGLGTGDTAAFTETYSTRNVSASETLTPAGSVNDGNGGNNYAVTTATNTAGAVTVRPITVTAAAGTKVYDGSTSSTATPTVTGGLGTGDTAAFSESYDTKNMGAGKTLTATGSVNDGSGGNNYTVSFATNTTGAVTARAITVTAATITKGYDGTTASTVNPTVTGGSLASGDIVAFSETFDTKNVGTGKTLTPGGCVNDGNGGANYTVTFTNNTSGDVTARALTVVANTSAKVYDGTTSSAAIPTITGGTLAPGDMAAFSETFNNRNAGAGKTLLSGGTVNDGNGGNNYTVTFTNNTTGDVTARVILVTAVAATKTYDGTTTSSATPTVSEQTVATGDTAAFSESYDTRNAGTGKTLTAAGSVNDGNGGANYQVTFMTSTAGAVTARPITVTAATGTKTYDGMTSSAATPTVTGGGLVTGDTAVFAEALRHPQRRLRQDAHADRLGQRRQRRQQLHGDRDRQHQRIGRRVADHRHRRRRQQDLRRHDLLGLHADDHRRQPGHRRHGSLHRALYHQERGRRQDAHPGRLGQRRQRRQ